MPNNQQAINRNKKPVPHSSAVGELILSSPLTASAHFLVPVLSGLANTTEDRWLTLILPKQDIAQTLPWIRTSDISRRNIQVLNPASQHDSMTLTQQALASGTSHTVISWVNTLNKRDLETLELAAHHGQCQGLTIRNRFQ